MLLWYRNVFTVVFLFFVCPIHTHQIFLYNYKFTQRIRCKKFVIEHVQIILNTIFTSISLYLYPNITLSISLPLLSLIFLFVFIQLFILSHRIQRYIFIANAGGLTLFWNNYLHPRSWFNICRVRLYFETKCESPFIAML